MPPNRPNGDGACVCPAQTPDHHHNNRQPRQGLTRRPIRGLHSTTWPLSTNQKGGKNTWTIVGQSILRVKGRNQAFYQLMFCGHLGETETDEYKVLKNEETPQATIRRWNHVYKYVVKTHYKLLKVGIGSLWLNIADMFISKPKHLSWMHFRFEFFIFHPVNGTKVTRTKYFRVKFAPGLHHLWQRHW